MFSANCFLEREINMANVTTFNEKLGIPAMSISSAHGEMIKILKTKKAVPCLWGEAGIGKTASVNQLGAILNKPVYTFICSHMSETDLGIPFRSPDNTKYYNMLPPKQVYDACSSDQGAILFFDEITRSDKATLNAIFSAISERRIGDIKLPDTIDIVAACNPDDGEYSVSDIVSDPAWRRRLVHMWVETDASSWLAYAKLRNIHKNIVEYIETKPNMLIGVEARNAGKIYPNPAAWEQASLFIQNSGVSTIGLSGMLGYDVARDLVNFIVNTEYRLTPGDVLLKMGSAEEDTLTKIKDDGRGDLLGELVRGVAMKLALDAPTPSSVAGNLFKFWSSLPEENAVLLVNEIEKNNVGDKANYFTLLYGELKKLPGWPKLLNKLKAITKLK
jgi:hypothetical protein